MPRPRLPRRWNEETVRAELQRLLGDDDVWPPYNEFVRRGAKSVRDAVTHLGGERCWAETLGLRYVRRSPGYTPRWTEARIREELAEFLAGRSSWPQRKEFEQAGRKPLRDAIGRSGGIEGWAAEFGFSLENRRHGNRRAWDDEEVERLLLPFVERLGRWPTRPEFQRAGLWPMVAALYRYGTARRWQERLGARPARGPIASPNRRIWTEAVIEARLAAFCAERGEWPTGDGRVLRLPGAV